MTKIVWGPLSPGMNLYAIVHNEDGQSWNPNLGTPAFATHSSTHDDFDITLPDLGNGMYGPAVLPGTGLGRWASIWQRMGGAPAGTDVMLGTWDNNDVDSVPTLGVLSDLILTRASQESISTLLTSEGFADSFELLAKEATVISLGTIIGDVLNSVTTVNGAVSAVSAKLNANFVAFVAANTDGRSIDELATTAELAAAIVTISAAITTAIASSQVDATDVDHEHTFRFDADDQLTAVNTINELVGFDALIRIDFGRALPANFNVNTVNWVSITAGSGIVLGTATKSDDERGVNIPVDTLPSGVAATPGTYMIAASATSTDGQTYVRQGVFVLEAVGTGT